MTVLFFTIVSFLSFNSLKTEASEPLKKASKTEVLVKEFSKKALQCLNSADATCLAEMTVRKIYFLATEFECPERSMTNHEFAKCVLNSTAKSGGRTLRETMKTCFEFTEEPDSPTISGYTIKAVDGYMCEIEEENGQLKFGGMIQGC